MNAAVREPPVRELTDPPARVLPGEPVACDACGSPILFALTLAGPHGRGGKHMPLDRLEDARGNAAVSPGHRGILYVRILGRGESADRPIEYLAMPHFATCPDWRGHRSELAA